MGLDWEAWCGHGSAGSFPCRRSRVLTLSREGALDERQADYTFLCFSPVPIILEIRPQAATPLKKLFSFSAAGERKYWVSYCSHRGALRCYSPNLPSVPKKAKSWIPANKVIMLHEDSILLAYPKFSKVSIFLMEMV